MNEPIELRGDDPVDVTLAKLEAAWPSSEPVTETRTRTDEQIIEFALRQYISHAQYVGDIPDRRASAARHVLAALRDAGRLPAAPDTSTPTTDELIAELAALRDDLADQRERAQRWFSIATARRPTADLRHIGWAYWMANRSEALGGKWHLTEQEPRAHAERARVFIAYQDGKPLLEIA